MPNESSRRAGLAGAVSPRRALAPPEGLSPRPPLAHAVRVVSTRSSRRRTAHGQRQAAARSLWRASAPTRALARQVGGCAAYAGALLVGCVACAPSRGADAPPAAHVRGAASSPSAPADGAPAPPNEPVHATKVRAIAASSPAPPARGVPKYPATTVPLSRDSAYLRRGATSDFWALSPYYVGQQDDVSCSLASLTMLANAARRHEALGSEQPLFTQPLLRKQVNSPVWERGLAPDGEGVTLDQLALLATESLHAAGITPARVEVTHVPEPSAEALARLRQTLSANEASGDDWLLLNFHAAAYVGVGDYGHIAPVGAYDADARRVLVMDPDRSWYEPYWVSDEAALRGMATRDSVTGESRGYLYVSACTGPSCGR